MSIEATEILVHALVSSRLDYSNCLLYGIPGFELAKLQRVQNTAARLILGTRKHEHITPDLIRLHWLPVKYRVDFKILLIVFKALNGQVCD